MALHSGKLKSLHTCVLAVALSVVSTGVYAEDLAQYNGAELFKRFCSSCHGALGRGDGPVAASLKVEVPDLTRLTRRPDQDFPESQVRRIVDGRAIFAAHGPRRMPVWGYEFTTATATDPESGTKEAAALIDRLVEYLRSIQKYDNTKRPQ